MLACGCVCRRHLPVLCRYLGVCNDSVGFIQAALGEEVTMFPCIVAGHAKHAMTLLYKVRRTSPPPPPQQTPALSPTGSHAHCIPAVCSDP